MTAITFDRIQDDITCHPELHVTPGEYANQDYAPGVCRVCLVGMYAYLYLKQAYPWVVFTPAQIERAVCQYTLAAPDGSTITIPDEDEDGDAIDVHDMAARYLGLTRCEMRALESGFEQTGWDDDMYYREIERVGERVRNYTHDECEEDGDDDE